MFPSRKVEQDLIGLKKQLKLSFVSEREKPYQEHLAPIIEHVFGEEGKLLRPQLLLSFAALLGCRDESRLDIATATEYIHLASLLHDDIIDDATLRRNQETLHQKWDVKTAVLVGDFLYSRSFEIIAESKHHEAWRIFAEVANRLSLSETVQLATKQDLKLFDDLPFFMRVIHEKTAILFGAACEVGVLVALSGDSKTSAETGAKYRQAAKAYGINLGTAFQLVDDYLDYFATSAKWGKQRFQDLASGKITMPLVCLYQASSSQEQEFVWELLQQSSPPDAIAIDKLDELMQASGALTKVQEKTKEFSAKALRELEVFPQNEEREALKALVLQLEERLY